MAEAFRFGWIGATRRTALKDKVAATVQAWLVDWHVGYDGVAPTLGETFFEEPPSDEICVFQFGENPARVAVLSSPEELMCLGNWFADIHDDTVVFAQDIGQAALADLTRRIGQLSGKGEVIEGHAHGLPQNLVRSELGAVMLSLDIAGMTIGLAIARSAADAICPVALPAPSGALQSRIEAADTAMVQLAAGLDFGTISMRELAELRVGEVLVGECPLDAPVRLMTPGGRVVGHARIGRTGNRMAVALTQSSSLQEKP